MASNDKRATRLGLLAAVGLMLLGALGARLWFVQTVEASDLQSSVDQRALKTELIAPQRGQIFDVDGRVVAMSVPHLNVAVSWDAIRGDVERAALFERLSGWVGVPVEEMEARYDSGDYSRLRPMPVTEDVPEDVAIALMERAEDFPGVVVERGFRRTYPYAPLAAHVVGYLGAITESDVPAYQAKGYDTSNRGEDVGRAGVELQHEDLLHGTWGSVTFEVDSHGVIVREVSRVEPVDGLDIQLSIDLEVQQYAESLLRTRLHVQRSFRTPNPIVTKPNGQRAPMSPNHGGLVNYPAPAGAVVVMDQQNGRVLAMASYPTYDNRWFEQDITSAKFDELFKHPLTDRNGQLLYDDAGVLRLDPDQSSLTNRAIQGQYNLGSTFKPFVAYAGVMSGLLEPNDYIDDNGTYKAQTIEEDRCAAGIKCVWRNSTCGDGSPCKYGSISIRESLAVSSDVFYYRLGELFFTRSGPERDTLQQWVEQFGFGADTGIDLPAEFDGRLPSNAGKADLLARGVLHPDEQPQLLLGDIINLSIGQGLLAATPIQLATAYAAIANGGLVLTPRVAIGAYPAHTPPSATPGVLDIGGLVPVHIFDQLGRRIELPGSVREPIIDGLRRNILGIGANGRTTTAGELFAKYPGDYIQVAGKTGTAQGAASYPWNDSSVFAAFSLDDSPGKAYTVVAYLEKGGYGSRAAGPVVKCMLMALSNPSTLRPVAVSEPLDPTSSLAARPAQWAELGCMAGSDSNNVTQGTVLGASVVD